MRDVKNLQMTEGPSSGMRARVLVLAAVFLALLGVVFARAVDLQVHQTDKLKGFAEDQYLRAMAIPARRGDITDRRGAPLAQSVEVDSVWVDPSLLADRARAVKDLARALGLDAGALEARLEKGRRFAWVKRQVTPAEVVKVKALGLTGLGFAREPRRFYPQRELAAQLIGLVGTDAHGLDGLERSFEDELSGEQVTRSGLRDAKGRKLLTDGVEAPQTREGAGLTLTIDRQVQHLAEEALEKAVLETRAVAGTVVVLDPRTGELLAVANAPRFNPNSPKDARPEAVRNRAVTDTFEPGSTFKPFVIATALDEKAIDPTTEFDCERGHWKVGRATIHDSHPYAKLNARGILQVSSNICTAKVAQVLGRERMAAAFTRFGFGERVGLGLPSEGRGVMPYPRAEVALVTQAFGQGLTVTAVQMAAAYGALANGGVLMKPYLVSKVTDPDGLVLLENAPTPLRRVVSEAVAGEVLEMLESVVEPGGTATRARLDAYRVAGKTGTAQKADPLARGYSDKRLSSFIGVVPAEAPRAVIYVVLDEPQTAVYGGVVAAPVFKEIAQQLMPLLGVPPSRAPTPAKVATRPPEPVTSGGRSRVVAAIERLDELEPITEAETEGAVRVPDVRGQSGREAVSALLGAALEPHLAGSGVVIAQRPPAGSVVDRGTRISIDLASGLPSTNP